MFIPDCTFIVFPNLTDSTFIPDHMFILDLRVALKLMFGPIWPKQGTCEVNFPKFDFKSLHNIQKATSGANLKSLLLKLMFGPIWPNLAQILAKQGTSEVTFPKFDFKYLHDIQKAASGANFKSVALKLIFGPIWAQFGPKFGPTGHH